MLCGIDEAGRGPLAGPVYAGAVILTEDFPKDCLNDSKKLSPKRREYARNIIRERAFAWGIGWASHEEIDRINIRQAAFLAMKRAFEAMLASFPVPLRGLEAEVDGSSAPVLPVPCRAVIKGDALVPEIMAASILAKTSRDAEMERYALLYPEYGYERHKGYPTKEHREKLFRYGPSPIQRNSFHIRFD
ncbi:MAG: ribonuclease HII [Spirochaetaceae bacterium]|jgi:ribonuclease HII|nr:ribonuclease HII [Spirochaetaceae bacterium]